MGSWAEEELASVNLGDVRRNRRLAKLVTSLSEHPTKSVPEATGSWAAAKAAYRLWSHDEVAPDAIRQALADKAVERASGLPVVLAVQDTTSLDFTHHPKTEGVGYLQHPKRAGLLVHSVLLTSPEGVPLGIVHQQVWARKAEQQGSRHQRRKKETHQKESQRWLTALAKTEEALAARVPVITVADREADIYDLLAAPRSPTSHLLIRATHNRRIEHEKGYVWEALQASPVRADWTVVVHRSKKQVPRTAQVTVRWETLRLLPPHKGKGTGSQGVEVGAILVEEASPPGDVEEPLCWLLFTTIPVESMDAVQRCVRYYTYRWLIERYHYVLKSGCRVEELQLEHADRLHRALATYSSVAWRLLWLTYEARQNPEQSCEVALASHEWQSLYCYVHRTTQPPASPPSLREATLWLAKLGGFLARKGDGAPGVKVLWRGLRRLTDIAATWQLFHPTSDGLDVGNA